MSIYLIKTVLLIVAIIILYVIASSADEKADMNHADIKYLEDDVSALQEEMRNLQSFAMTFDQKLKKEQQRVDLFSGFVPKDRVAKKAVKKGK